MTDDPYPKEVMEAALEVVRDVRDSPFVIEPGTFVLDEEEAVFVVAAAMMGVKREKSNE